MEVLRDAVQLAPSDWQPHYRLASNLAQQGHFSQAAAEYQDALRLDPGNVRSKLGLAAALLNLGHQQREVVLYCFAPLSPAARMA